MAVDYLKMERNQWCIVRGAKIGTTGAVSQYLILFLTQSTSRTGFAITALSSLNLFLYIVADDVYYERFSLIKLSKVGWFVASSWNQKLYYFTEKLASSPGHSQFLMLHVEKRESLEREITCAN